MTKKLIAGAAGACLAAELLAGPFPDIPKDALACKGALLLRSPNKDCETVPAAAFVKGWEGVGVIMLAGGRKLEFIINLATPGTPGLEVCHLAGGEFGALAVEWDGLLLGKTAAPADTARPVPMVSKFDIPCADGGERTLALIPLNGGPVAVAYVKPGTIATSALPEGIWELEKTADGKIKAKTLFHKPTESHGPFFILRAAPGASLSINDVQLGVVPPDGAAVEIKTPRNKMKRGMNTIQVALPAGAEKFVVESSPLGGCRFFKSMPKEFNPQPGLEDWPRVILSNGVVKLVLALPDMEKGYYRGTRFEQAGIIHSLECGGHGYFTEYVAVGRNPLINDHVAGPAEEFREPLGYDEAKTGGSFVKLGVGLLERPLEDGYSFGASYWIVKALPWRATVKADRIEFVQELSDFRGWGYVYTKRLILPPGEPKLRIEHVFKNTGKRRIVSNHYSHNFIAIDGVPSGPAYDLRFGWSVQILNASVWDRIEAQGPVLILKGGAVVWTWLVGPYDTASNWVSIALPSKQAAMRISEDFVPIRVGYFQTSRVICPESFFRLDVAPGDEAAWTRIYEFGGAAAK